ncbi:MAG TPA: hypothetical protein VFZ63_10655 [Jiangellaceae bacterium]
MPAPVENEDPRGLTQVAAGKCDLRRSAANLRRGVSFASAIYAALAMLLEDVQHRTVLPLLRRNSGSSSMTGGLAAQVQRIEGEAGVREQL